MEELSKKEEKDQSDDKDNEDFVTSNDIKDAVKDLPEVYSFIQRLQECILRQRTLLHRLYAKIKAVSKLLFIKKMSKQLIVYWYPILA